jgi:hypothetical protein
MSFIESEPTLILPNDVGQIFHHFQIEVLLRGFKPLVQAHDGSWVAADAKQVEHIVAAKHRLPALPAEGLPLPAGSIAIALIRNTAAVPAMIKGVWATEEMKKTADDLLPAPSEAMLSENVPATGPEEVLAKSLKAPDPDADVWRKLEAMAREMVILGERSKNGNVRVIAPGTNERAVLLVHNEVLLLIEMVRTGRPIEESWKWAIVRKLEEALR